MKPLKMGALMALLAASVVTQGVLAAEYTVRDLDTLGGSDSFASDLNGSGQVVGRSRTTNGAFHAFLYSGGALKDLGTLGGTASAAVGINAAGQVVGTAQILTHPPHAFLYSGDDMIDLGTLGGTVSAAVGINATGQVVGTARVLGDVALHAFLYSGRAMTDLNSLLPAGVTLIGAMDINAAGQIVGEFETQSQNHARHAFLYSGGTLTDLRTLGGTHSVANGINAAGQVVGTAQIPGDGAYHAFLYSDETLTDLGTLGGTHSVANGINAAGQVVGTAQIPGDGAYHAFLYSDETMTDLNDLVPAGVTVTNATGINATGQIVADGRIDGSTNTRALLLTPIVSDRFAYALADAHTAASYTPGNAYNASGGAIRITRQGVGRYDVAFDDLPTSGTDVSSAVAVTAHGSSPITCSVVAYDGSSPSRTVVQVGCINVVTQLVADSPFTILVVGNQSLPKPSAFVRTGGPAPDAVSSWTSTSKPISVTHTTETPGEYHVLLGTGNTRTSAKLVTGTTGVGTRCIHAAHISGGLRVRCYDGSGAPTDRGFSVVQVGGGRPGRRIGFAIAHEARASDVASYTPYAPWSFNSADGVITATNTSTGHYTMHFAGLQTLPGRTEHVQVSAAASPALATCNVVKWENVADGLTVVVECRDGDGQFRDSVYYVLVIE